MNQAAAPLELTLCGERQIHKNIIIRIISESDNQYEGNFKIKAW